MRKLALPFAALVALSACVADVGEGKVAATVEEPAPEAQKAAPAEKEAAKPANILAIDPVQSTLKALGAKITATHPVVFHSWSGDVKLSDEGAVVGLAFAADVASLESDHPKLTVHLKDADFLDVEKFPKATFVSKGIEKGTETEGASHTVSGDLTIRGTTKRVSFPATIVVAEDGTVKANTEFVINRQDFGVTYPGRPDDLVQDNVVLTVSIVAPPKA